MTSAINMRSLPSHQVSLTAKPHAFGGAVLSPKHARELTPSLCLAIASALSEQAYRRNAIPYTLWITEAWRVLGWAEPSAALFWEMATMYHTLYLAGRSYAADYNENLATAIPPILSCGSTSSMGSGNTPTTQATTTTYPNMNDSKKKFSTAASAKELPVWLVGSFLLLHCEESAYLRNLSGQDERRFYGGPGAMNHSEPVLKNASSTGKVDFTSFLKHPALSPRYEILLDAQKIVRSILFCMLAQILFFFNLFCAGRGCTLVGTMTILIARRTYFDICANCCFWRQFHTMLKQ